MTEFTSFRSIIALWPSREAMASDVGAPVTAVTKWGQRNSIPADWWASVLATARAVEAGITAELLIGLAARDSAEARA